MIGMGAKGNARVADATVTSLAQQIQLRFFTIRPGGLNMRQFGLVLVLFVMLAAACSGADDAQVATGDADASAAASDSNDDTGTSSDAVGSDTSAADDNDDEAVTQASGSADEFVSPLADFLGRDFGNFEDNEAEFARLQAEAETLTAQCMAELGFEYTPQDISDLVFFSPDQTVNGLERDSDEWIEIYGFGITTEWFPQSVVGPDLLGFPDETFPGGPESPGEFQDPNQEYIDSLSPTAQEAYFQALHGTFPDFDPTLSEEEQEEVFANFEPGGCSFESQQEVFSGGFDDQAFFEAFGDQLDDLFQQVEAHPRIVEVMSGVSECVADRGLTFSGQMDDVFDRFFEQVSMIGNVGPFGEGDPFVEAGLDPETMTEEEINDFLANLEPPMLSPEDQATLARLQAEEIELAVAINECGGGPRDTDALFNEVRIEIELEFLETNAEALEEFAGN